jgi:hypothetical protein
MTDNCTPKCVRCGSQKHVHSEGSNPHQFYCGRCKISFEDVDDGEVGYGNPERFATRNERHESNQRDRLLGKRPTAYRTKASKNEGFQGGLT